MYISSRGIMNGSLIMEFQAWKQGTVGQILGQVIHPHFDSFYKQLRNKQAGWDSTSGTALNLRWNPHPSLPETSTLDLTYDFGLMCFSIPPACSRETHRNPLPFLPGELLPPENFLSRHWSCSTLKSSRQRHLQNRLVLRSLGCHQTDLRAVSEVFVFRGKEPRAKIL